MRFLAFFAVLLYAASAHAQDDTFQCLDDFTGPVTTFTGEQALQNWDFFGLVEQQRMDARGATFYSQTVDPDDYRLNADPFVEYPVDLRDSGANVCWAGGAHVSNNPLDITWQQSKGHGTGESYVYPNRNSAAIMGKAIWTIYDGLRIHNQHDSFRPYWANTADPSTVWQIRNSWVSYNRDDCIEQDNPSIGFVEDSLFDGCYVFFSATWQSETPLLYTISNSLIRLQKMPGPFSWDYPDTEGHGEIFKAYGVGPHFALHDNIFLIEGPISTRWLLEDWAASVGGLGFRNLDSCSGNIIVWVPPASDPTAPYPGDIPDDQSCVTVTTDTSVWNDARDAWIAAHPLVMRIPGVDDAPPAPAPEPIPEPVNMPPVADFNLSCADLACSFFDASTDDGTVARWQWEFGDGTASTEQNPRHSYAAAGDYAVTLTVWDDLGAWAAVTKALSVIAPTTCNPPAGLNHGQTKRWIRLHC